jgi:hypothetical protein
MQEWIKQVVRRREMKSTPTDQIALQAHQERVLSLLTEWSDTYGKDLCPGAGDADTFGDGMRAAKKQVKGILSSATLEKGLGYK